MDEVRVKIAAAVLLVGCAGPGAEPDLRAAGGPWFDAEGAQVTDGPELEVLVDDPTTWVGQIVWAIDPETATPAPPDIIVYAERSDCWGSGWVEPVRPNYAVHPADGTSAVYMLAAAPVESQSVRGLISGPHECEAIDEVVDGVLVSYLPAVVTPEWDWVPPLHQD